MEGVVSNPIYFNPVLAHTQDQVQLMLYQKFQIGGLNSNFENVSPLRGPRIQDNNFYTKLLMLILPKPGSGFLSKEPPFFYLYSRCKLPHHSDKKHVDTHFDKQTRDHWFWAQALIKYIKTV